MMNRLTGRLKILLYAKLMVMIVLLTLLSIGCSTFSNPEVVRPTPDPIAEPEPSNTMLTRYGDNIVYYDFSKIPVSSLVLNKKISVPDDLKKYLDDKYNNPRIEDSLRFAQDFWEEAAKLGFNPDQFKVMTVRQTIRAIVKIIGSRFTYLDVDNERSAFAKEYGTYLSTDTYFHLGLGDCDKYTFATIAGFHLVKESNPRLQNVYLSRKDLGGYNIYYAWISVLILQENRLVLSHIDPTFADNDGKLEADDFHLILRSNIFIADFYRSLSGYENWLFAYQILDKAIPEAESKRQREKIASRMTRLALRISFYKPAVGVEKILPLIQLYETEGFTKTRDNFLFRTYRIYSAAGKETEAENYKQKLYKEFPDSFWTNYVKTFCAVNEAITPRK